MNKIVISNATPIISLCSVGYEYILKELFTRILISQAVDMELRVLDKPGSRFGDLEWVEIVPVRNKEIILFLRKDIDTGEAETIALAKQMNEKPWTLLMNPPASSTTKSANTKNCRQSKLKP